MRYPGTVTVAGSAQKAYGPGRAISEALQVKVFVYRHPSASPICIYHTSAIDGDRWRERLIAA